MTHTEIIALIDKLIKQISEEIKTLDYKLTIYLENKIKALVDSAPGLYKQDVGLETNLAIEYINRAPNETAKLYRNHALLGVPLPNGLDTHNMEYQLSLKVKKVIESIVDEITQTQNLNNPFAASPVTSVKLTTSVVPAATRVAAPNLYHLTPIPGGTTGLPPTIISIKEACATNLSLASSEYNEIPTPDNFFSPGFPSSWNPETTPLLSPNESNGSRPATPLIPITSPVCKV